MKRRMQSGGLVSQSRSSTRSMLDPAVLGMCTNSSVAWPDRGAWPRSASGTRSAQKAAVMGSAFAFAASRRRCRDRGLGPGAAQLGSGTAAVVLMRDGSAVWSG